MSVTPLTAWDVEDPGTGRQPEDVDQSSDFASIAFRGEQWLVLEQILPVEITLPPFSPLRRL